MENDMAIGPNLVEEVAYTWNTNLSTQLTARQKTSI